MLARGLHPRLPAHGRKADHRTCPIRTSGRPWPSGSARAGGRAAPGEWTAPMMTDVIGDHGVRLLGCSAIMAFVTRRTCLSYNLDTTSAPKSSHHRFYRGSTFAFVDVVEDRIIKRRCNANGERWLARRGAEAAGRVRTLAGVVIGDYVNARSSLTTRETESQNTKSVGCRSRCKPGSEPTPPARHRTDDREPADRQTERTGVTMPLEKHDPTG